MHHNDFCNQHTSPHQHYCHDLMREFNPNDPNNKNRTFDKMVQHANRKHLNPGEQSFHYYFDPTDNKIHGFIAIGNINDCLPHIIITDNTDGKESALQTINNILKIVYKNQETLEIVKKQIETLLGGVEIPEDFTDLIAKLNNLEQRAPWTPETAQKILQFINNNEELFGDEGDEQKNLTIRQLAENIINETINNIDISIHWDDLNNEEE